MRWAIHIVSGGIMWVFIRFILKEAYSQKLLSFSLEMANKYYGAGVQLDSYNLKLLGVHPEYQKQGHGTALFNFVEPKASTMVMNILATQVKISTQAAAESRSVVLETVGESAVRISIPLHVKRLLKVRAGTILQSSRIYGIRTY